jgi:hypothetical protein
MNRLIIMLLAMVLMGGFSAHAATDNPTVDAKTRAVVHQVTMDYINANTVDGIYRFYDVVTDDVVEVKFVKLHSGIRTTDDFFNTCANFENEDGVPYDVDFLLIQKEDGSFTVTQPFLHGIGKQKRPFHP